MDDLRTTPAAAATPAAALPRVVDADGHPVRADVLDAPSGAADRQPEPAAAARDGEETLTATQVAQLAGLERGDWTAVPDPQPPTGKARIGKTGLAYLTVAVFLVPLMVALVAITTGP